MEAAEKNRGNAAMNGVSTDVMHKFLKRNRLENENEEKEMEEDEEIELSLGLSMNGRFGVDPTRKKLRRSSSVSNVVVNINSVDNGSNPQARGVASGSHTPLVRTCSLPSESHEWRRREEFQSVGGVEAGGERMEELKIVRVEKEKEKDNCSDKDRFHGDANGSFSVERLDSESLNRFENWNSTQSPQRLIERGGSSGISHLQRQLVKEATQNPITKGSSSRQFPQEPVAERPAVTATDNGATDDESVKNPLVDMPYVSTRGYGPNHNKIEGFLYGYKRGEEVKIVCVCHGMFLSPAEFVKHGGGGDVAYPLKHIVVNPFPLY